MRRPDQKSACRTFIPASPGHADHAGTDPCLRASWTACAGSLPGADAMTSPTAAGRPEASGAPPWPLERPLAVCRPVRQDTTVLTMPDCELPLPARPENVAVVRHAIGGLGEALDLH